MTVLRALARQTARGIGFALNFLWLLYFFQDKESDNILSKKNNKARLCPNKQRSGLNFAHI